MRWQEYWLGLLAVLGTWNSDPQAASPLRKGTGWTSQRKLAAREKTRDLWYHGFDNYMRFAFPMDELAPISCSGRGPDWHNPNNIASNDVAGNFSLTLIDVLDTLVVLDDRIGRLFRSYSQVARFEKAVRNVIEWVSFDVNTRPQVFETNIRVLGGLLSGHIFANQSGQPFFLPWYRGELLDLAYDLGKRLLPAFKTPTGLPYARINLRHGMMKGETLETCTAGAGSLILEFATLSRLTGDDRFEKAAHKAFFAIWNRRSDIGLVGNTINTWTGDWTAPEISGIGAGIDSYFEYALKWYILSGETEFLDVWEDAYASIMRYSRAVDGFWYRNVNMRSGDVAYYTVDSLSAFWPGLQVLAGDIQSAIKLHFMYYNLWRKHSGLPEVYDTNYRVATSHQYPLRPEFIESTWYLYRATRDPLYLEIGERILFDLVTRAKVDCGLTGITDLRNNHRDDRMESFVLSETIKYLFLLFDEDNPLSRDDSNYVFTTEGHILSLGREHIKPPSAARRKMRKVNGHQCPAYSSFEHFGSRSQNRTGLLQGIPFRGDVDYARELVSLSPSQTDMNAWSPDGWCERPKVESFAYDFILSVGGQIVAEDLSPSLLKLAHVPDGFVLQNVTGVRTQIVQRLDGKGYDVRKLGHYAVRPGQVVYINDTELFKKPSVTDDSGYVRDLDVPLRFYIGENIEDLALDSLRDITLLGYTSFFGGDLSVNPKDPQQSLRILNSRGVPMFRDDDNLTGCLPYTRSYRDGVLLVQRGDCTFLQKLVAARDAGAIGVVVISDEDLGVNPTANKEELMAAGEIDDVAMVILTKKAGQLVEKMMDKIEHHGTGHLILAVDPDRIAGPTSTQDKTQEKRILYLNGHALINTILLV
ncbi:alpha mannosidase-like protein [Mycena floridula]|nr:alpha mannosidase-like protein [Mycena floridula]